MAARANNNWKSIVAIFILVLGSFVIGCEKEEGIPPDNLSIAKFEPLAGLSGDTIVIVGNGFDPQFVKNVVQFNASKKTAEVLSVDENGTRLEVVVPDDAQAGNVKVATGPYSALSNLPFLLAPSIGSVNPAGALPGEQIVISGKNFTTSLTNLLIYIGETEIDSIFGGSSTQIIFPLPEGLPVGTTDVRVGTRLTATDSVMSPPVAFTVFDPRQPVLSNLDPNSGTPGAQFTINGNGFNMAAGKTKVNFGNYTLPSSEFESINPSKIVLRVPADYPIDGKAQETVDVSVTVSTEEGDLNSPSLSFTVIEPSDEVLFYFTALNIPGFSNAADDRLYRAQVGTNGIPTVTSLTKGNLGVDIDEVNNLVYFGNATSINKINLDGSNQVILPLISDDFYISTDVCLNMTGDELYYYGYEAGGGSLVKYELGNGNAGSINQITFNKNIKFSDNTIFSVRTDGLISYINFTGPGNDKGILYTKTTGGSLFFTGIAVAENKVYFVEGPADPETPAYSGGSSKIYSINRDGSGVPIEMYTVNEPLMDLEISKDGTTLYWMVVKNSADGAIMSGTIGTTTISNIKTEISGIRNGRYFDILE